MMNSRYLLPNYLWANHLGAKFSQASASCTKISGIGLSAGYALTEKAASSFLSLHSDSSRGRFYLRISICLLVKNYLKAKQQAAFEKTTSGQNLSKRAQIPKSAEKDCHQAKGKPEKQRSFNDSSSSTYNNNIQHNNIQGSDENS